MNQKVYAKGGNRGTITYFEGQQKQYLAVTALKSNWYKTEKGAENFMKKLGYELQKEQPKEIEQPKNKHITTITIDNVFRKEEGERKIKKLKEITKNNFHNFKYGLCPIGGSFDLIVTSNYYFESQDPQKEMLETFVFILANQI